MVCIAAIACLALIAAVSGCNRNERQNGAVLVIESTPKSGAQVAIGDKLYGTTPVTIPGLDPGQYYAILNLYGFKRVT